MYYALAIKNIRRRKVRSFLSALGIFLGVALIVSLASISDGLDKTMEDVTKQIGSTIYVVEKGKFGNTFASKIDSSEVEQIERIPGVKVVSPISIAAVDMEDYVGKFAFLGNKVYLTGLYPDREKQTASGFTKLLSGRMVARGETEGTVLAYSLASSMNKKVGDRVVVKHRGASYDLSVVGIFENEEGTGDDHLLVDMGLYKKITGEPEGVYNMVGVVPTSEALSAQVERKIKFLLPNLDPAYARSALQSVETFSATLRIATWVIAGISAIIGGLGIANAMIMSVVERTKDFGILRAVGWRDSDIMGIVILESLLISSAGAILGILLGAFVSLGILPRIISTFRPSISALTVAEALGFALLLGIGGAIVPAKRAAAMNPVDAFRK